MRRQLQNMEFVLTFPPSGHIYRIHPMVEQKYKRKYLKELNNIGFIMLGQKDVYKRVTFIGTVRNKTFMYDYDNFVFGVKPVLDVLVTHGVIAGDRPWQVKTWYHQEVSRRATHEFLTMGLVA